jgi:class 3 adenylate cyclase
MAEALGGQILITDDVREHAEPRLDWSFLDAGLFWLRGFPESWRHYEVSWDKPQRARGSALKQPGRRRLSSGTLSVPACDGSLTMH